MSDQITQMDTTSTKKIHTNYFETELQKVVQLPPNLTFMIFTFPILTQCKITENTAGQGCAPDKNIFPYHLSVLEQVLGL